MEKRLPNIDLTPSQYRDVKKFLNLYLPDVEVWAYGSRVTFKARHNSDLDLVAFVGKEKGSAVYSLKDAFVESSLPFSVDVMMWETIPDHFKPNIRRAYYVLQEREAKNEKLKAVKLGEVSDIIGGGTPSTNDAENYGGNIPWITPKDLSSYSQRYIKRGARNITEKGLANSSARILPANTVLFSTRAPIGYIAIAANEVSTNQGFKGLVLNDGHIPEFYYYLLKHHTPGIIAYSSGSTFGEITANALKSFEVKIPDTQTQKAIAHVLGLLDDKIEHNHKVSETLEETAKAIFQSWFVDFAPVRAKMEGRPTGLSPDISALFPEKLTQSKIGEIPQGWEVKALDQIGIFRNGLALQNYPAIEGQEKLPVIKIAQLRKGNTVGDNLYASGVANDFIIDDEDFIFSWSGTLMAKYWVGGKGALNQHLFKVEGKNCPLWYVSEWVKQYMPKFQFIAADMATTMGHIKREHLKKALCVVPPKKTLSLLGKTVSNLIKRQILALQESKGVSELRDILLPKLISGELQIADAEKLIKEAT